LLDSWLYLQYVWHVDRQIIGKSAILLFAFALFPVCGAQLETGGGQGGSQVRVYGVTPITAPERAVYEVFAAEVAANERLSQDGSVAEEQRKVLRTKLQLVAGLPDDDYAALRSICTGLMSDLEANARKGNEVLRNSRLTKAERDVAIRELRAQRDEAIDVAIDRWKLRIGRRFRWVDQNIRAYVAPGLRLGYREPVGPRSKEGTAQ
jgi:hypothetical protein